MKKINDQQEFFELKIIYFLEYDWGKACDF